MCIVCSSDPKQWHLTLRIVYMAQFILCEGNTYYHSSFQGSDSIKLKSYLDLLQKYLEEKKILSSAINNSSINQKALTSADVIVLVDRLKTLKHYGKDIVKSLKES
jgi:hypothetical protein